MRYFLLILTFLLLGCGTFIFRKDRVVYKNKDLGLSCIGTRCCVPYAPNKIMFCSQGKENGDYIFIRVYFDK